MKLGLIADTHGLMRPQALEALRGSELILHAGDIGAAAVLDALRELAPVIAIRGNNDTQAWAAGLPETERVELAGRHLYLLHDRKALTPDALAGVDAVISGHSHKPLIESRDGLLYINPGSAGPRRFSLPVTVARLTLAAAGMDAQILPLL